MHSKRLPLELTPAASPIVIWGELGSAYVSEKLENNDLIP
jgi:hypothetical protein